MSQHGALRASRLAARAASSSPLVRPLRLRTATAIFTPATTRPVSAAATLTARRSLMVSAVCARGIMPHTENPAPPEAPHAEPSMSVVDLSESEYHERADAFLDTVAARFELLQDSREDIDIEFAAGVMTINIADKGTYVINKQPPNKQIWLSSPISGPKRYDWCVLGESQGEKEGTGVGAWIYMRDRESLSELIHKELGIVIEEPDHI